MHIYIYIYMYRVVGPRLVFAAPVATSRVCKVFVAAVLHSVRSMAKRVEICAAGVDDADGDVQAVRDALSKAE